MQFGDQRVAGGVDAVGEIGGAAFVRMHFRDQAAVGVAYLGEVGAFVDAEQLAGLGERVVYRELFPKGLTLLDLAQLGNVGISHIAARQELREMIAGFGLPEEGREPTPLRAAAG